ncbi:hypothetical protein BaRGS_00017851 [Batillaria attramentaria]|uniref:Transmembrane protein 47 n=1 Tax=Batillaria attramentaria TaxID=370345 RepID=A0ABD0KUS5_9CAEN
MATEGNGAGSAPTTTIETLVVVRPLKVIAVVLAALAMMLMMLSVAATTWLEANSVREGLWEKCTFRENETDMVDCDINVPRDWLQACRALCMIAMILTFIGIIVASVGLRSENFRFKYRYYVVSMVIWFSAVGIQLISLVTFPIKFLDEIDDRAQLHWEFGWAYGVGWGAAVFIFVSGILLLIDKGAEEIIYREVTTKKESLEEEEGATEAV